MKVTRWIYTALSFIFAGWISLLKLDAIVTNQPLMLLLKSKDDLVIFGTVTIVIVLVFFGATYGLAMNPKNNNVADRIAMWIFLAALIVFLTAGGIGLTVTMLTGSSKFILGPLICGTGAWLLYKSLLYTRGLLAAEKTARLTP